MSEHKSSEQQQYEGLTSYFKDLVRFASIILAIIAAIVLIVTYNDRSAMREEYSKAITELKGEIRELKNESKGEITALKVESKETAKTIKDDAKETVKSTKEDAENEISRIKVSTNAIALQETQKQIESIFATRKIQDLIENQAVKEVKDKVDQIVMEETKNITKINDAGSKMRIGLQDGMWILKSYFEKPENAIDSARARVLYNSICQDYYSVYSKDVKTLEAQTPPFHIVNDTIPSNDKGRLISMINQINDRDAGLEQIAYAIISLSIAAKKEFKPFDIEEINKWFKRLK